MKKNIVATIILLLQILTCGQAAISRQGLPRIVSRQVTKKKPPFHLAIYSQPKGLCLVNGDQISKDNGKTWSHIEPGAAQFLGTFSHQILPMVTQQGTSHFQHG